MRKLRSMICVLILPVLVSGALIGQAYAVWQENGLAVCERVYTQVTPYVVPDGEGGVYVVWVEEGPPFTYDGIYAQRLDAYGSPLWTTDGVVVCDTTHDQRGLHAATDGEGGVLVVWQDWRCGSALHLYAQHLGKSGSAGWPHNGVPVCTGAWSCYEPKIISDAAGGAIIVWRDDRVGGNHNIYAQRLDKYGTPQWAANGDTICEATGYQQDLEIAPDGYGGAIITWEDSRGADQDIYAQRVNRAGSISWTPDGEVVCNEGTDQTDPALISDGEGGAIITWKDHRAGVDIYAQRMTSTGSGWWTANGIPICSAFGDQEDPQIVTDCEAGAIITWEDCRGGSRCIYAQRVDVWGNVLWAADGVTVCAVIGYQVDPQIASDENGGAIITWLDGRKAASYGDVYGQKIDASGSTLWASEGVPVCRAVDAQYNQRLASDGCGGAIMAWDDYRNAPCDIYAQRVDRNGYWGYPAPTISAVHDIPGDQGGWVTVAWDASRLDAWPEHAIYRYTLWRAIDAATMMSLASAGASVLTEPSRLEPEPDQPVILASSLQGGSYYWEYISSHYAYELETYSGVAPTLFDSTSVSSDYHYFQVIAHRSTQDIYWISEPDSGYSVDNLAPVIPFGLTGEYASPPPELLLTWDPNTEEDLAHYAVYKGSTADFVPDETNRIGAPADTFLVDTSFNPGDKPYYKLSAWDIHENESGFALLRPEDISGLVPTVPTVTELHQNMPNPFVDGTAIRFSLARAGHVALRVYDVSGRPVRILIVGTKEPDRYEILWDSRDDRGALVAPGVFFYRLEAPGYSRTMKMVSLK